MDSSQWIVLAVFVCSIAALVLTDVRPSHIFACVVLALIVTGQLTFEQVLVNVTNQGLVTLVLLMVVSAAVEKTSVMKRLSRTLVTPRLGSSFARIFTLAFFSSALLNNTAVVANLVGPIKQNQYHPSSRLLIPLSYAAILGGTVTLIGTSTNLIVNTFLIEQGHPGFGFWDFTPFGLTAGLVCGLVMFLFYPTLPDIRAKNASYQEYFIEAEVESESELVGKTVEQNHLRNLPELFLVEVIRRNKLISPVGPELIIEAHDKLIFSGNVSKVESLSHIKGLTLFAENSGLLKENLTEVIVSHRAQIIGQSLKAVGFRSLFDAAVVAIRRDGEQLSGKLGEIRLQAGDYLLLATGPDFLRRAGQSRNFFVLSEQTIATKLPRGHDLLILGGFLSVVVLSAMSVLSLATGLFFLLAALIAFGILNDADIRRNLPLNLIVVIIGALSLAGALEESGLVRLLMADIAAGLVTSEPIWALILVFIATLLLTELVTNNAAAALMFPFAYGIVEAISAPLLPFALAVAFAASASFISPHGYQTNMIVYNATAYRFSHFARYGLPVSIAYSVTVLTLLNLLLLK